MLINYKCRVIFPQGILETVVTDMALEMTKLQLMLPHPRANELMQSMIYFAALWEDRSAAETAGRGKKIVSRDVGADHNTASDTTSSLKTSCQDGAAIPCSGASSNSRQAKNPSHSAGEQKADLFSQLLKKQKSGEHFMALSAQTPVPNGCQATLPAPGEGTFAGWGVPHSRSCQGTSTAGLHGWSEASMTCRRMPMTTVSSKSHLQYQHISSNSCQLSSGQHKQQHRSWRWLWYLATPICILAKEPTHWERMGVSRTRVHAPGIAELLPYHHQHIHHPPGSAPVFRFSSNAGQHPHPTAEISTSVAGLPIPAFWPIWASQKSRSSSKARIHSRKTIGHSRTAISRAFVWGTGRKLIVGDQYIISTISISPFSAFVLGKGGDW